MNAPYSTVNNIAPAIAQALKAFMPPARKKFSADIDSNVQGIPCGIKVDRCFVNEPMGPSADSDWDCYGYSEIEFTVLDRKGYEAPWLQAKLTDDDIDRIEIEILESMKETA
jgi:hypothetical protein